MISLPISIRTKLFGVLLLSVLAGCSTQPSQPTHFYRLSVPSQASADGGMARSDSSSQPLLGVGPVELASYLDRPQIINRLSPYQLELQDFHHWAGKLQENITQVLVDSLEGNFGNGTVVAYPWHRLVRPQYELALDVSRLDTQEGQLILQVSWTLIDAKQSRLIDLHQLQVIEPVTDAGAEATVAAASRALQQLAADIAERLQPHL